MRPRARTGAAAFTLVEMLVVIAVIAVLAALTIPAVSAVRRRSQASATLALMQRIGLALDAYKADFGSFPPPRLRRLGLSGSNGQNEGGECLVRGLLSTAKTGPYLELEEGQLGNTDGDSLAGVEASGAGTTLGSDELLEVLDPWGNPLAYLTDATYDQGEAVQLGADGGLVRVAAAKDAESGQYRGLLTYQLWSAGPDGKPDTDDDLRHWGE